MAEIDVDRSLAGDEFSIFYGPVEVEGSVDPAADTATVVIRPIRGPIKERASVFWAWTSATGMLNATYVDFAEGACPIWVRGSAGRG